MKDFRYIIRKRALGDVLWIEPVIRMLAQQKRKLIVHTRYNELFENFPFKNVVFKKRLSFFEKVFVRLEAIMNVSWFSLNLDNSYEKKPHMHFLHAYEEKAGLPFTNEYPRLYLSEDEKKNKFLLEDYVVLHLESFSDKNYRKVYGIEWNLIVNFLQSQGMKVVQIGVNCEPLANTIYKKTNIRELISLIYHSKLFIGLDSGPSHIAASLGIPSMIFFGGINPLLRHFPESFNGVLMQQKCQYNGCYHQTIQNIKEPECKLVGDEGIPKCSVHSTVDIIANVQKIITDKDVVTK